MCVSPNSRRPGPVEVLYLCASSNTQVRAYHLTRRHTFKHSATMTTATTHSTMASATPTGRYAQVAIRYTEETGSECDPTDMAASDVGSDLPQPADTLLKWVPCAQLQQWAAGSGDAECWSGTGAFSAYPGLRLNHF